MVLDPYKLRRVGTRLLVSAIVVMALYGYARFSLVDYPRGCDAMTPTISSSGAQFVLDRYMDHARPMRRLDIVVYDQPGVGGRLVGRVRALPGDTLSETGGLLAIAGEATSVARGAIPVGPVPNGAYVVLNENAESRYPDSRVHGFVLAERIAGRMIATMPGSGR